MGNQRKRVVAMRSGIVSFVSASLILQVALADEALVQLLEKIKPSVVTIETDMGSGTGFFVASDKIMTNHHVIEGASEVFVKFSNKDRVPALGTLYIDKARDIAVLNIKPHGNAAIKPFVVLDGLPKPGQDVIALGSPRGFEFTVTRGIVSSVRSADDINKIFKADDLSGTWVQTDASISPGNSGGPLINHLGQVVGMSTFYRVNSQNLNFAISSVDMKSAFATASIGKLTPFPNKSTPTPKDGRPADYSEAINLMLSHVETILPKLSTAKFRQVQGGDLSVMYEPVDAKSMIPGQLARLKANTTVIQILEDGILVKMGTVKCVIQLLSPEKGAELRAKLGDDVIINQPIDELYYIGKSVAYETVGGKTSYYFPILPMGDLPKGDWKPKLDSLIEVETQRRDVATMAAGEVYLARTLEKLRRTFVDSTGKFKVDAVAVEISGDSISMFRMTSKKKLVIPLSKLSSDDKVWIKENAVKIELYGPRIAEWFEKKQ